MGDETSSPRDEVESGGNGAPGAERVYEEYLKRRAAGEQVDFEDLCQDYPQLRAALECLHLVHQESQGRDVDADTVAVADDSSAFYPSDSHVPPPGESPFDDDTGADEVHLAVVQDAGGDDVQHRRLTIDDERVARVVAALEARHEVRPRRQPIYDLPLAFVAPLGADSNYRCHC